MAVSEWRGADSAVDETAAKLNIPRLPLHSNEALFVSEGADQHVRDSPTDPLYSGGDEWAPSVLDVGSDDHDPHGRCWLSLAESKILKGPSQRGTEMPPPWSTGEWKDLKGPPNESADGKAAQQGLLSFCDTSDHQI